ncbi:MAG: sulfite exporter TauE/SafE family protein [Candidatus Goldiibacteriota bacterium]
MGVVFLLIFLAAVIFSMIGLGGGILYVPILLQTGLSFNAAASISLAIILVMALTSTFIYHREKLIDWYVLALLEPFSIAGAYIAGYNASFFSEKFLYMLFGAISLISAYIMIHPPSKNLKPKKIFPGIIKRTQGNDTYHINMWYGAPFSFIAGFVSAILGIGGGFAKVPLMKVIFGMPVKSAVATSSAMIVITAATGLLGYAAAGQLNFKIIGILAFAVFLGANIGTRITIKANNTFISYVFSIIMIITSIYMFYSGIIL